MGKQQDWDKISKLRKIVKDRKTTIIKNPNGNIKGGVILTDETLKPYMEKLAALEAKTKTNREQMTTVEHIDDNTAEIIADAEQNKDEIKEYIAEQFATLAPNDESKRKQDETVPCTKRLKIYDESNLNTPAPSSTPHDKADGKVPLMVDSLVQQSSDYPV